MKYLSVAEIAEKWNISDRRVRTLCSSGRILGAKEEKGHYLIPANAKKPFDGRYKESSGEKTLYLKWADKIIAEIKDDYCVYFSEPNFNKAVSIITRGKDAWDRSEFEEFLADRIVSRDRRDIEKILFRLGFSKYDTIKIALATRAINSKDLLWIAFDKSEKFSKVMTDVFESVFIKKKDLKGDSVDSPEGFNTKRYGVYKGKYGIYKRRINPLTTDVESEQAVYELAKMLKIDCCPAYKIDEDTVFSEFKYDFAKEYIVHFRNLIQDYRSENEYQNLLSLRPQYQKEIIKMICLDFITRQDDRHLSNIAIKVSEAGESFYPLYDNGRSLFYDETEETVKKAVKDIKTFSTSFGPEGTYYDYVQEIAKSGIDFSKLINLDIDKAKVESVLKKAGFSGYRLKGSVQWITKAVAILKNITLQ